MARGGIGQPQRTRESSVPEPDDELAELRRIRVEDDRQNVAAAAATRRTVRALANRGLTVRGIGRVLGISHQRVDQLLEQTPVWPVEPQ